MLLFKWSFFLVSCQKKTWPRSVLPFDVHWIQTDKKLQTNQVYIKKLTLHYLETGNLSNKTQKENDRRKRKN